MKKTIANILILCILMCSLSTISFASQIADEEYTVSGVFKNVGGGKSVSLFVLNDGVTIDFLDAAEGSIMDKICHVDVGITSADGRFSIPVTVSADILDNACVFTCDGVRQTGILKNYIKKLRVERIYVSSDAVGGTGTVDDPYGSVNDAFAAANDLYVQGYNVEVLFNDGEYYTTETLSLTQANTTDTYMKIAPVSSEGKVVISGMKKLSNDALNIVTDSDILARLPENSRGKVYSVDLLSQGFDLDKVRFMYSLDGSTNGAGTSRAALPPSLYLNGKRQSVAKYPNQDWITTTNVGNDSNGRPWLGSYTEDMTGWENAYVMGFLFESFRVKYAKAEEITEGILTQKLVLDGTGTLWTNDQNGDRITDFGPRYIVCNIIEEMDVPGEWCIDETNGIMYYFAPYALTCDDVLEIPYTSTLISASKVNNLTIENLELKGSRTGSIIAAQKCENLKILNCNIHSAAKMGVSLASCKNSVVDSCNVYDIGSKAIYTYGGADVQNLIGGNNVISNNHVYDYSNNPSFGSANMGISIGRGDSINTMGDIAENNLIHVGKYAGGVIYGGMDNIIRLNEIYNVITDTQDAGAIYAGRRWNEYGNVLANNFIHDFSFRYKPRYTNRAIYWDDYQSGQTAVGNIIVSDNSQNTNGILTIGADNVIRGNILVNTQNGIRLGDRLSWDMNFVPGTDPYTTFEDLPPEESEHYDKIMALKAKIDADPHSMPYDALAENNVLVNSTMSVSEGFYEGKNINTVSLSGNDVFVNAADMDYTLKASVVSANGITEDVPSETNFDMDSIGIQKDVPFTNHEFSLMYPANGGKLAKDGVILTWEEAVFADRYDYVISRNAEMTDVVKSGSTRETFVVPSLENGTYYWQVTAVNTSRNMGRSWNNENGVCSFTVSDAMPLEIIDIKLTEDGKAVAPSADVKNFDVNYTVYNKNTNEISFTAIAAIFRKDSNSLISAHVADEKIISKGNCITDTIDFALASAINTDDFYIRVFVLDNLEKLSPKSYSRSR